MNNGMGIRRMETLYIGLSPHSRDMEGLKNMVIPSGYHPLRIVFDPVHYGVIRIPGDTISRGKDGVEVSTTANR